MTPSFTPPLCDSNHELYCTFEFLISEGFLTITDVQSVHELYELIKAAKSFAATFHVGDFRQNPHIHVVYFLENYTNQKIKKFHTALKSLLGARILDDQQLKEYLKLIVAKLEEEDLASVCDSLLATPELRANTTLGHQNLLFTLSPAAKALQRVMQNGPARQQPHPCLSHFKPNQLVNAQVSTHLPLQPNQHPEESDLKGICPKQLARWQRISDLIDETGAQSLEQLRRSLEPQKFRNLALRCGLSWRIMINQVRSHFLG